MDATTSYADASREELVSALDQLHGVHNAVLHEMLLITAELERRNAHLVDGQRNIGAWLQLHLGVGRRTAQRWSEAAAKIGSLPHLAESFAGGRISFDKLSAAMSYATPENDRVVAEDAENLDAARCERVARRRREVSRTDEDRAVASKRVTFAWADMGTRLDLWASLPADEGATVIAAIERIADSLPVRDAEGNLSSLGARRADALVMLAATNIAEDQDPDRATVSIHIPVESLIEGRGVAESGCGGIYSADVTRRLLCDSRVQAVVEGRAGEVVGISAVTRTIPGHMRRQLEHRDGGTCRFPGCANRLFLDGHHIKWWTEGGPTEIKNLALFCRWHHRLFHEGGWGLRGDPDRELGFIRPDGTALREGPEPLTSATRGWLWDELLTGRWAGAEDRGRPPPQKTMSLN